MKYKKGFTLNELLVTIAIIGILASVVSASLLSTKERSRDAKRVSELKDLEQAIELYFQENHTFPTGSGWGNELNQYYETNAWTALDVVNNFAYSISGDGRHYCIGAKTEKLENDIACPTDALLDTNIYKYRFAGP